jgi:catechol 2,3-dioxygenase-like lactoylglutathione lyase family enzyme
MTSPLAEAGGLRIEIFVRNVEQSVRFYTDVLGFTGESGNSKYRPVRKGAAVIGIGPIDGLPPRHPLRANEGERVGLGVEIVVEVADVDATHSAVIDAGWAVETPPGDRPWGLRDFRLLDPDGYYIRVTSR